MEKSTETHNKEAKGTIIYEVTGMVGFLCFVAGIAFAGICMMLKLDADANHTEPYTFHFFLCAGGVFGCFLIGILIFIGREDKNGNPRKWCQRPS